MNTREIIKEIRKSGKVAMEMSATEIEVVVDKSDLIRALQYVESTEREYSIHQRDGYRVVFSDTPW
jgi:hypothetical protein